MHSPQSDISGSKSWIHIEMMSPLVRQTTELLKMKHENLLLMQQSLLWRGRTNRKRIVLTKTLATIDWSRQSRSELLV
jgi:hypothetical protein